MDNEVAILKEQVQKLKWGVWFSFGSLICALLGLVLRFTLPPTFVVANPPKNFSDSWQMGPFSMMTVEQVAKREGKTSSEIISSILNNKMEPAPLFLEESNVTWAIYPNYTIFHH